MKKLSFKEYLSSKQKLRESILKTSHCSATYSITKYCRLPIIEDDIKNIVSLKPNQFIIVEWFYENNNITPIPISIIIEDATNNIDISTFNTTWSGNKLLKWLKKNSIQKLD